MFKWIKKSFLFKGMPPAAKAITSTQTRDRGSDERNFDVSPIWSCSRGVDFTWQQGRAKTHYFSPRPERKHHPRYFRKQTSLGCLAGRRFTSAYHRHWRRPGLLHREVNGKKSNYVYLYTLGLGGYLKTYLKPATPPMMTSNTKSTAKANWRCSNPSPSTFKISCTRMTTGNFFSLPKTLT